MKKIIKLLALILVVITIYLIYNLTNKNNKTYIALGDSLSVGINSYNGEDYSYSDYFKDYLIKTNKLSLYTKEYTDKNKMIKDIYNDILTDKTVTIKEKNYNIKELLRESDVITLSIGLNDIIFEYNTKGRNISEYEEDIIIDNIFKEYKSLIKELKKYYQKKIYIIGYFKNNTKYDSLIEKLNRRYKDYAEEENDIYISTDFVEKNKKYFDSSLYYPNTKAYEDISKRIISKYKKY